MLKILLTGGSCAGKTEFLPVLEKWLKKQGLTYVTVSETATMLLQRGEDPKSPYFQQDIFVTQYKREEWANNQPVDVVIFDRGFLDQQSYTSPITFLAMGKKYCVFDSKEEMYKRYDLVLHFESNAAFEYETEGRLETQEEAIKLEEVTKFFTTQHSNCKVIRARKHIEDKFDEAERIISEYLPEVTLFNYQKANNELEKEATKMDISTLTLDELLKIYDENIALEIANAYHLPQGHELGGI